MNEVRTRCEFDFNWNSSPQSVICTFPYVIAFTNDTMEIRLLVNGNLVHMATMAELSLLTNKKDIFFTTTAPEFIPRKSRIKGLEPEDSPPGKEDHSVQTLKALPRITHAPEEDVEELRVKMENISAIGGEETEDPQVSAEENGDPKMLINENDNLNRLMVHDPNDPPTIQRARSLQGKSQKSEDSSTEKRRLISKSNSCGETPIAVGQLGASNRHQVPPNSPSFKDGVPAHDAVLSSGASPRKQKPLRIYRIPLSHLMGTNHHMQHIHHGIELHNICTNATKIQASKIVEDGGEATKKG